jgi:receptor expression-enhancing protein 1/2/3/4
MPAFECFKTVEARPNDAHMLRFWCQYWYVLYDATTP